jgi:polysaccharide chain length determinant protein (PEP-CTERM system associated)
MITTQNSFNIHNYIDLFLRRKWYIITSFVLIMAGTIIYLFTAPRIYQTSTMVLVTPPKISEAYVKSSIPTSTESQLQNLGYEILSRSRLEKLITEFNLYPDDVKTSSMERAVDMMRRDIQLNIKAISGGQTGGGYFTISYMGGNPTLITDVTNKLAALFIQENVKQREQQAKGTVDFLESELAATKQKVEVEDQKVTNYKRQFLYELPDQREANLRVLEQLQGNQKGIADSIRAAEDRKILLQNRLAELEVPKSITTILDEQKEGKSASPMVTLYISREQQVEQLRSQLADLQFRYTDNHPDIIALRKKIVDLENKIRTMTDNKNRGVMVEDVAGKRYLIELRGQLASIDKEIQRLKGEEAKNSGLINTYRVRVENSPIREITLSQLNRDYNQTKDTYQNLLRKKEEALQGENLERRQKGEQYRVIDPARVPKTPFKPDIVKVLLLGLLAGLGAGFGTAFLREQLDRSFRDAEDLEATIGLRVLANIPKIGKEATA